MKSYNKKINEWMSENPIISEVCSMTYGKGDYKISVEHIKEFGKNPGLWVHKGNEAFKMASFGSFEKAELFCAYMEYFLFGTPIPDIVHEGDKVMVDMR